LLAFTSERVNYAEGQELCHRAIPETHVRHLGGVADVLIDTPTGKSRRRMKKTTPGRDRILCDVPRTATI